jgi:hypothetical protein
VKRAWLILLLGLALAAAAYAGVYYACTAHCRRLEQSQTPELAWLKQEFQIDDAEFARIQQLHDRYQEGCMERCRQIDEKNRHLRHLLASSDQVTPEIAQVLSEAAQLRAECQRQMLQHFYEVSRTMPLAQGRRYLEWVQSRTILPDSHSQMQHDVAHHP